MLINLDEISFKWKPTPCFLLHSPVPKDREKFFFKLRQSVEKKVVVSVQQLCNKELGIERWGAVSVSYVFIFSWHELYLGGNWSHRIFSLGLSVMSSAFETWKTAAHHQLSPTIHEFMSSSCHCFGSNLQWGSVLHLPLSLCCKFEWHLLYITRTNCLKAKVVLT